MSIASKVVFLFVSTGLFLVSIATGYVAQREFNVAIDEVVGIAEARTQDRAGLQFAFYRQDSPGLTQLLDAFMDGETITGAVAYNTQGEKLAARFADNSGASSLPPLHSVRARSAVPDTSLVAFDSNQEFSATGFWSTLMDENRLLHLSIPVFSPVGALSKTYSLEDFVTKPLASGHTNSLVVLGYINLSINRDAILRLLRPTTERMFAGGLVLLFICTLPVYLYMRSATGPIDQLKDVANQFLSGETATSISVDQTGEYKDIALVLEGAIKHSARREQEAGLEHKLLLMTAGERASQLSLREEELSRAAEEISATRDELHRLANYDPLTSLPNRQLFGEQLDLLLRVSARNAKPLAVLLLSIDNFHRINDSLGRGIGDQLLQEIASRLEGCLRESDVLAFNVDSPAKMNITRLSGDEFAIVLGQLDSIEIAGTVAQRVAKQLIEPLTIEGHELVTIPKIGIAVSPRNGMDVDQLLKFASTAMQHARLLSGASYLYYSEDMQDTGHADLKLEAELRKAIARGELSLHYQPQVDITDGSIVCVEALLRWEHPEFGLVSPARFIQLAEESGQIWELGDWVLGEVCRQVNDFKQQDIKIPRVAINISPQQIQPAFVARVREVLQREGIPPAKLELGLSEAILMEPDKIILSFLKELKEVGVYLSLENFGTSHAPISYLSRYPIDEMKIDRSFVAGCDKQKDAARLATAIIAMATALGLPTVAEGVETEGEYRFLSDRGVIKMRGYLFSKPVTATELQKQLAIPWHYMAQIQRMALMADLASTKS